MQTSTFVSVFAPAKINLTLHVTGQRADGYHLLDSLVAFADVGDELVVQTGKTVSVITEGPEAAAVPVDMDNLVLKVAALFEDMPGASFLLTKNLPVSSGIGGGSADAAAAFRGLMTFRRGGQVSPALYDPANTPMAQKLLALGADIPMCLLSRAARIRGIGEEMTPLPQLPELHAVLINPRCRVATPSVFSALKHRDKPPMPATLPRFAGPNDLFLWLARQRNDLEEAAMGLEPVIGEVKSALAADQNCRLARMSGSGATVFGLYDTAAMARAGADALRKKHKDWWVRAVRLGDQLDRALPRQLIRSTT
ncbi:4-(cytidine 5'-diphospho)-2-C-methyl-D-erythritol kinase [Roseobacter weihaiensis]|uniref:4-(cytidine 5'-diphospho)-2-C-methyl-D-erythritol kinase n=1 Tax=Roseobacter weihaiensis TaxID=2763262 RepID=UPI001D09F7B6|nr:4-(cytidine 5'-diphospho)-2-C-methyl-D-erythritol kinase [Roseobacter sp. H9]